MKNTDSRLVLTFTWVIFFVLNITIVLLLNFNHWLNDSKDFTFALTCINNLYSPYLGVILIYYWNKKSLTNYPFNTGFYLAFIMSLLWNGMITILIGQLLLGQGDFNGNFELVKNLGGLFSWIVAGAIGFYFGKDS